MQKKISIIIPCYNAACFIEKTLQSILKQDYSNYEIIIIDDGSKDNSLEIIYKIAPLFANKITIETGPNRGASAARNRGTALATGDYIQYLDADDLLAENTLSARVQTMEKHAADVVYTNWQKLEELETGNFVLGKIIQRKIEDVHPNTEIALFTNFWCPPVAILYRKTLVDKIGGWNLNLPIIQDARFFLDAALLGGKFSYLNQIGGYYRVLLKDSLSRRNPSQFMKDCYVNTSEVEKIWQDNNNLSLEKKNIIEKMYKNYAINAFIYDNQVLFQEINAKIQNKFFPKFLLLKTIISFLGFHISRKLYFSYIKKQMPFKNSNV